LAKRCPDLVKTCYWAGTAPIALEELGHRESFDLDFHTRKALRDVRPLFARIQAAFPNRFEVLQAPDELGSGFRGLLQLPDGQRITLEVLSNYQDVCADELVRSETEPGVERVTLARYLADKIQCVAERAEARDLVDIAAVLRRHPQMEKEARQRLAQQDALLITERLLAWTDADIELDLAAYPEVDPAEAKEVRGRLLGWVRDEGLGPGPEE
jgi:hypothetical protein